MTSVKTPTAIQEALNQALDRQSSHPRVPTPQDWLQALNQATDRNWSFNTRAHSDRQPNLLLELFRETINLGDPASITVMATITIPTTAGDITRTGTAQGPETDSHQVKLKALANAIATMRRVIP